MNVCVFAGSSFGRRDAYRHAAECFGRTLAERGMGLVFGGACVGLMGTVADAALDHGGTVVGVIPQTLVDIEIAHRGLTELKVVQSMHERKAEMADRADAFAVLPGGIGSLEEAFEIWTWSQLGLHRKSIGLLNVEGFYDGLERFLDHLVIEAFVKAVHRGIMLSDSDPDRLLDKLVNAEQPVEGKWIPAPGR